MSKRIGDILKKVVVEDNFILSAASQVLSFGVFGN